MNLHPFLRGFRSGPCTSMLLRRIGRPLASVSYGFKSVVIIQDSMAKRSYFATSILAQVCVCTPHHAAPLTTIQWLNVHSLLTPAPRIPRNIQPFSSQSDPGTWFAKPGARAAASASATIHSIKTNKTNTNSEHVVNSGRYVCVCAVSDFSQNGTVSSFGMRMNCYHSTCAHSHMHAFPFPRGSLPPPILPTYLNICTQTRKPASIKSHLCGQFAVHLY